MVKYGPLTPNESIGDEESIYNLIPPVASTQKKRDKRHKSRYDPKQPVMSSFGGQRRSYGWGPRHSVKDTVKPGTYMKKNAKRTDLPQPSKFSYNDRRKAPLKTHDDEVDSKPSRSRGQPVNWVKQNKKNATTAAAVSKKRSSKRGSSSESMHKLGEVPAYLHDVKQQVEEERELVRSMVQSQEEEEARRRTNVQVLPEEERVKLLEALKAKWDVMNAKYQKMTHRVVLDTIAKVREKEQLEDQLTMLEKSIERMSKKVVYIHD